MRLRTSDTPVPRRHLRALAALSAAAVLLALVAATQAPDASATAATTATIAAATSPAPPITGIQYMGNVGSDRIVTDKVALIIISDNASEPVCGHTRTCLDSHRTMATSGQTILWHNPTDDPHVMVSGSPGGISGLFDTGVIAPGGNKNIEIDAPGRHEYFCVVHPWVRGVIHVAASPTWHHSPLEQQEMGVLPEHIVCGADVHLGYRTSDAAPVCLPERGLRMHAERGLVIPRDAGITSERLDIDKERFADMLTAYMGHEDVLVTTESADDLEEHREKITYKREVMAQIYNSIRLASTTEPDEGFTVRDDGTVIHSTGTPSAHTLEEILGIQSRSIDAAGEDRGGPRQEADVAEYSQTNIQVAGVDEPDFVKNDADSIYVIAQNDNIAMVNVDGSTGGLSAPGISPYIRGAEYILLHQDTLAVLAYDGESTTVTLLGVSAGPAVLARLGIGGELRDARMINDTIYVMTASGGGELPALRDLIGGNGDDGHEGGMHEIHFFKSGMASDVLYTVTAIPLSDTSQSRSASFVTGHADTVYVSADNIYVAHIQQEYGATEALFADGLFFRHAIGSLEPHERVKMYAMEAGGDLRGMAWLVLDSLESGDFGSLVSELESDGTAPEWRHRQNTSIHRIAVDGTSMRYAASGLVGGWLLDSFALNQGADGMLRAVTASAGDGGPQSNVYTLDEDMDVVGALEGIAPGETLHSARFSGDWLYAVTFRQVDPFFVIDVSDAEPEVLGVLKIPGYSEYLQNYDETHVIGIGRDTNLNVFDETEDAGIKISMFDVSDFENPREVQSIIVGDQSTDSAGLAEHKSLLIDDKKGILSIPIRFGGELFFYVYSISDDYTMQTHSKIPHAYDESNPNHVRSLYIGDVLYTITPKMIKANDLLSRDASIGSLDI